MKKNSTKKALLMSALSLLLCISMLVGTTYAWFTDTVTSAGNKIVAGTLDVDLLMHNGTAYASIADKDAAIFGGEDSLVAKNDATNTLWEPGKTQIVYLGVENKGNLDLKYNILLNVIDGGLVGSLEYAIIDGAKAGALSAATKWADIEGNANVQIGDIAAGTVMAAPNGAIKAGDDAVDYFALAIHMKEEAGNEYQGKDITIDVTVAAAQLASEEDSFDHTYDELAELDMNGVIYHYEGDDLILDEINADFEGDTYVMPEGVVAVDSWAITNPNLKTVVFASTVKEVRKQAFDSSSVETVILNEGLEVIGNRGFAKCKKLTSITIPSTVKEIGEYAFQVSGLNEITVEGVDKVGNGAFAYCPDLETITIIGDTTIGGGQAAQNYIARDCASLKTVYLLGDMTFVNGSMTFTNKGTGYAKDITVYVTSEADKAELLAASSSSDNDSNRFNVVVMDMADPADNIDTILTTAADGSTVYLSAGEYTITKSNQLADNLTVICEDGVTINVKDNWSGAYKGVLVGDGMVLVNANVGDILASNVTFENCNFPYGFSGSEGNLNLTMTNCTVNGKLHFVEYGTNTTTITNTTATEAEYYSAGTVEFVGCTIDTIAPANTNTVLTGCTVNEYKLENMGANTLIVDGVYYAGNAKMLKSALNSSAAEVAVVGEITLTEGLSANNVTLIGVGDDAAIDFDGHNIMGNGAGTITYKKLSLSTVSLPEGSGERSGWYGGIDYAYHATANYIECNITGVFTLYSDTVNVTGCKFDYYYQNDEFYNIFVYGADVVNVSGCTFEYGDRAVKIYTESATAAPEVNITGCTFVADEDLKINKALIEIDAYAGPVVLNYSDLTIADALSSVNVYKISNHKSVTINGNVIQ